MEPDIREILEGHTVDAADVVILIGQLYDTAAHYHSQAGEGAEMVSALCMQIGGVLTDSLNSETMELLASQEGAVRVIDHKE